MPMSSSPFRESHRRSRSHTSLSSPSSSPLSRSDKHHSSAALSPLVINSRRCGAAAVSSASPFSPAYLLAVQPPEKWDVEVWRRGKRARRNFESPSEDADMESCDEPLPSSPMPQAEHLSNSLSTSAPSTPFPRFATTSDAFQFFPSKGSSAKQPLGSSASRKVPACPNTHGQHVGRLTQMHSEAFDELRKTVSEAGEGFVRRMREFEAHRNERTPRAHTSHIDGSGYKLAYHKRGRKRPSPSSARQHIMHQANTGSHHSHRGKASDSEDGLSDIEIRSSYASGSDEFRSWSPSKKRAVSLSSLTYYDPSNAAQSESLPFPIPLRSRERSSSPSPSAYSDSSSEDEDIASSSSSAADRLRNRRAMRLRSRPLSTAQYSPPPLSFSFSTSNNSSHLSLGAGVPSPISLLSGSGHPLSSSVPHQTLPASAGSVESGPSKVLGRPVSGTSKRTEKAVAALSLALANGAGSVSDYKALREAQGVLTAEDGQLGSLWD